MATLTFNTTAPEDAIAVVAFGTYLNLGRNATLAEIRAATIAWFVGVVNEQQFQAAKRAIVVTNIAPT